MAFSGTWEVFQRFSSQRYQRRNLSLLLSNWEMSGCRALLVCTHTENTVKSCNNVCGRYNSDLRAQTAGVSEQGTRRNNGFTPFGSGIVLVLFSHDTWGFSALTGRSACCGTRALCSYCVPVPLALEAQKQSKCRIRATQFTLMLPVSYYSRNNGSCSLLQNISTLFRPHVEGE